MNTMYSTAATCWRSWAYCGKLAAHLWWTISQRTAMSRIGHVSNDRGIKNFKFTVTTCDILRPAMFCSRRFSDPCTQANMTLYTSSSLNTTCQVKRNPSERETHKNGIPLKRTLPHPMASPINRKRQIPITQRKRTMLASIRIFSILADRP